MMMQRVTGREAAIVFDTDSGWLAIEFKDRQASDALARMRARGST